MQLNINSLIWIICVNLNPYSHAICLQMYIQNDVIFYACVYVCVCMYMDVPDSVMYALISTR